MSAFATSLILLFLLLGISIFSYAMGKPSEVYVVTSMTIDHSNDDITLSQSVFLNHDLARKYFDKEVERIYSVYSIKEFYPEGYKIYADERKDLTAKELRDGIGVEKKYVIAGINENNIEMQTNILLSLKQI